MAISLIDLQNDAISALKSSPANKAIDNKQIQLNDIQNFRLNSSPTVYNFDFINSAIPSTSIVGMKHILTNNKSKVTPSVKIDGNTVYNPTESTKRINTVTSNIDSYSFLPMPQAIQANYPKSWEGVGVGLAGMFVNGEGNSIDKFRQGMSKTWNYGKEVAPDVSTSKIAGMGFGSDEEILRLIRHNRGNAVNDKVKLMFKDLPFRSFGLAYALFPKNEQDMENVFNWIKNMKKDSAPNLANGLDSNFWTYPKLWKLTIQSGNGRVLIKTLNCALTDVATDYTPDGIWSQHYDGNPTKINVTLNFTEIEPAYSQLYVNDEVV